MSDPLNPTGPSQPTQSQAYTTPGNPATHNPAETAASAATGRATQHSPAVDHRVPSSQHGTDDATPTSLGRGVRGAPRGEEAKGLGEEDVGRHTELDGEQMAAPGEGRVRDAVVGEGEKTGASGGERGLETDLDRYGVFLSLSLDVVGWC